ncbi:phosphatase PAP2 family protein [Oceanobacillus bengalensis]|uniref:Phosphatase PAP2 family protein n=1 Tax=Oceanobacillus bengalensis TaxID=1435466 RepID=A0A494Z878_9BACI|nr:phosphatase PAP2 family protein [Oceanobacillus bengalensis]RKQ18812.1 phosphatase PAP2 family protein [Oceanobacillus bengalensis]
MLEKRNRIILYLFIIFLFITCIWIVQIMNGYVPYVDSWTRELVGRLVDTSVYRVFLEITNLGSRSFLIPFVIVTAVFLWMVYKNSLPALFFAGGTLITHSLNKIIKNIIERERPSILEEANALGHSFPSGHAMISMVCYGLLAYFFTKKLKSTKIIFMTQIFFLLLILLIGISRYVINVHYLTDVLAGFFIGALCLIGFIFLYEKLQHSALRPRGKHTVDGSKRREKNL